MKNDKNNDIKLFLWLIPFANIINYYLTYTNISLSWRLFATFTIDTIQGYIAWLIVRTIIIWLDKRVSYDVNPVKRIVIQQILTLLGGISSIILLTELLNWLTTDKPVPVSFYTKDLLIISIWFFVANGIYVGLHYYNQWHYSEEKRKKENELKTMGFKVSSSKKDLFFSFEEIVGFYSDGDYSMLVNTESKKFLVDSSLNMVETNVPSLFFFRLNRQYIIHRQIITGFEKGTNGKLNVLLKSVDYLPKTIPVSRTKAPGFKLWFTAK